MPLNYQAESDSRAAPTPGRLILFSHSVQVYYVPAGDAPLDTHGFVPLVASDAASVTNDQYEDYDACNVRRPHCLRVRQ